MVETSKPANEQKGSPAPLPVSRAAFALGTLFFSLLFGFLIEVVAVRVAPEGSEAFTPWLGLFFVTLFDLSRVSLLAAFADVFREKNAFSRGIGAALIATFRNIPFAVAAYVAVVLLSR